MREFKVPGFIPLVYVLINVLLFHFCSFLVVFFLFLKSVQASNLQSFRLHGPCGPHPTPLHPTPPILTFSHSIKEEKPVHIVSKWMKKVSHPKRQRIKNDHNMLLFTTSFFHSKSQLPIKLHKTYPSHLSMKNHS